MITCPECGQQAEDGAKFCDRCGQGLAGITTHPVPASILPLEPDTELKGEFRITALLNRSSHENRYRAVRIADGEPVQLREQAGPNTPGDTIASPEPPAPSAEDPSGPRAKTAELSLESSKSDEGINGVIAESSEPRSADADDAGSNSANAGPAPGDSAAQAKTENSETHTGDAGQGAAGHDARETGVQLLTEVIDQSDASAPSADRVSHTRPASDSEQDVALADGHLHGDAASAPSSRNDDFGEVFGRVLALSMTLNHPAFHRALSGFSDHGRVYLVYRDEELTPLSSRTGSLKMDEPGALNIAIQVCQAVSLVHRRGLRVNDICPESVAKDADGRVRLTGLDYVSNDNELQLEAVFNDGYTAPEIYRGKKIDKRADIFSIGALLYTFVTGERLDSETWREEAGPIRFYPPHVVTPALESVLRRTLQFDPAARFPNVDSLKAELVKLSAMIRVRSDALTDVGRVREHNEDSVLALECKRDSLLNPAQMFLYVVADGMGGAEAGEVASAIAVETIRNYLEPKTASSGDNGLSAILQEALEQANSKIIEYQTAHPEARSMGSTAVAALINPPEAAVAWVGDSRAYIHDGLGLRQLTKDHSLVQRLLEIGQITPEEARHHEHKNVITRSLGARPTGPAGVESIGLHLKRGNRLLLCSDGLTTHVDDSQIEQVLRHHSDPTAAARELVVAANAGGGTDNVSVVVIIAG